MLLFLLLLCLPLSAQAENRVNIMTGEYEVIPPDYQLRFNIMQREWQFVSPEAKFEFNHSTLEFEYPGAVRQEAPKEERYGSKDGREGLESQPRRSRGQE